MDDLRANLEAECDSLEEELAEHGRKVSRDWQGTSGSEGQEPDPTDSADNIEELSTNIPLVEELEARYKEVGKALGKIDKGAYGICEVCQKEIPFDRLEANPAASTCVEHA